MTVPYLFYLALKYLLLKLSFSHTETRESYQIIIFTEHLQSVRLWLEYFQCIITRDPHKSSWIRYHYSHFTDEKTAVQKSKHHLNWLWQDSSQVCLTAVPMLLLSMHGYLKRLEKVKGIMCKNMPGCVENSSTIIWITELIESLIILRGYLRWPHLWSSFSSFCFSIIFQLKLSGWAVRFHQLRHTLRRFLSCKQD